MEILRQIPPLSQQARIDARETAKKTLLKTLGEEPERTHFVYNGFGKYPKRITALITILCVTVLIGAFLPSSFRLYVAGSTAFSHGVDVHILAVISGIATVIMAETAQVVASLALATLGTGRTSKRILYAIMVMSTFLALVGNWSVAQPYDLFSVIEAIFPPLIVLGMSFILKEQMLVSIEDRYASEQRYQHSIEEWRLAVSNVESHSDWQQRYASALRDQIVKANKRKKSFNILDLPTNDWQVLVWREMKADEWFQIPTQDLPSINDIVSQAAVEREVSSLAPLAMTPSLNGLHRQET